MMDHKLFMFWWIAGLLRTQKYFIVLAAIVMMDGRNQPSVGCCQTTSHSVYSLSRINYHIHYFVVQYKIHFADKANTTSHFISRWGEKYTEKPTPKCLHYSVRGDAEGIKVMFSRQRLNISVVTKNKLCLLHRFSILLD